MFNELVEGAGWVYQEMANSSAVGCIPSDYVADSCWGDASYPFANDSAWGTYARGQNVVSVVNWTYVKPANSVASSRWMISKGNGLMIDGYSRPMDVSIPSGCWDYSANNITFKASIVAGTSVTWSCQSGASSWTTIYLGDAYWVWEEGMYWNVSTATSAPVINATSPQDYFTMINNTALMDFKYDINGAPNITSCSLIINDKVNKTVNNSGIHLTHWNKGGYSGTYPFDNEYEVLASNNITINLSEGSYTWAVNCTDLSGFSSGTGNRDITILNAPESIINITSNTTNPTPSGNQVTNFYLELNNTGYNDLLYVNYTLKAPNQSIVFSQVNGTYTLIGSKRFHINSTIPITTDDGGEWNITFDYLDNNTASPLSGSGSYLFNVSDTQTPFLNLTSPSNNTGYIISTLDFNITLFDDLTERPGMTCYYNNDSNPVNISLSSCDNFTKSWSLGHHNLTFSARDTYGNFNNSYVNFSIITDTTNPTITITQPTGTKSSVSIASAHLISDNEATDTCYYNVTRGASLEIFNTAIACNSLTASFTVSGDASYTFNIWANDSSNNVAIGSSNFTVSTGGGEAPGGGGGAPPSLRAVGQTCSSNSDCVTNLCDISKGSKFEGTCQLSLCGNNVKDEGENFDSCPSDVGVLSQIFEAGNVWKFALFAGGAGVLIYLGSPALSKKKKKAYNPQGG